MPGEQYGHGGREGGREEGWEGGREGEGGRMGGREGGGGRKGREANQSARQTLTSSPALPMAKSRPLDYHTARDSPPSGLPAATGLEWAGLGE